MLSRETEIASLPTPDALSTVSFPSVSPCDVLELLETSTPVTSVRALYEPILFLL